MYRLARTASSSSRRLFSSSAVESTVVRIEKLRGKDEGIALLTMDRPKGMNALGKQFMEEFNNAVFDLRGSSDVRVVIVRSTLPKAFCVGADLKERRGMTAEQAAATSFGLRSAFTALEQLPMPTIAAIEGVALGGGLEMALACDFRVAGGKALLGAPETALAIIPGAGGTQRLPRLIGVSKAKELVFTSRRIGADSAKELGLVEYAVDEGEALDKAMDLAREILPNGPVGVRMAKEAISRGSEVDLATGLAIERACYAQVAWTNDRLEGLEAFNEKRKPEYKGE